MSRRRRRSNPRPITPTARERSRLARAERIRHLAGEEVTAACARRYPNAFKCVIGGSETAEEAALLLVRMYEVGTTWANGEEVGP